MGVSAGVRSQVSAGWHDLRVNAMPAGHAVRTPLTVHVDAMRLLRLVRVRRELRIICVLAVAALPAWAAFTLIAESVLSRSSKTFWSIDAKIGAGFLLIGAVLVAASLLLLATRCLGHTGRVAARLSPVFGRGHEAQLVDDTPELAPLVGQLRRKSLVSLGAVLFFLVVGLTFGVTAWNFWPAWQANHGHRGQVVTIGREATVSGYEIGSHGHKDYYLDTPDGPAIAEDYKPHDGQRWTVLHNEIGNDEAYLVGGHDYLLIGVIALVSLLILAGIAYSQVVYARAELAVRRSIPHDLARAVTYLGSGNKALLRVGQPSPVTLTLRPLGERTAQDWLRRRRLATAALTAVALAVAGTGIGLWQSGVFKTPPGQRDVSLGYLAGTTWDPDVFADYHMSSDEVELVTNLHEAGVATPHVRMIAALVVSSMDTDRNDASVTACVDVADVDPAQAGTEMSAILDTERRITKDSHDRATSVPGLPAGWQGVLGFDRVYGPEVDLVSTQSAHLVWISLNDTHIDDAAQVEKRGVELVRAIAGRGLARFSRDVATR